MDWLKYFFLSFFKDEYAGESHKRSLLNSVLSLFLAISIMCSMLFLGYSSSMKHHYEKDEKFKNKVYNALAENDKIFKIDNGKFSLTNTNKDDIIINESSDEIIIITDTRDNKNAFIKFTITYTNKESDSISYEDYRALSETEKAKYTFSVQYTNELIDFNNSQISEYEAHLSQSNDEIRAQFFELQGSKSSLDDGEYTIKLYELFVKSYYPNEVIALDMYSFAPTLRTYYDDIILKSSNKEFFVLYEDLIYLNFENGITSYTISGHAKQIENQVLSSSSEDRMINNIDSLIFEAFEQSKSYIIIAYIFNFIQLLPILMMAILVLSLISCLFFRFSKNQRMLEFLTSFKLINLYTIVSALLSGTLGFALSWSTERGQCYRLTVLTFALIITLRLAIYLIKNIIIKNKRI